MNNVFLTAALHYRSLNLSVIPVCKNKHPYISWKKYQTKKATKSEINKWWSTWQDANIGLVCGEISGIDVLDIDNDDGLSIMVNKYIEESDFTKIPIVETPNGYHLYFIHRPGLTNGVRVLPWTDIRTNGGYVLAPPSINNNGKKYIWAEGSNINEVKVIDWPVKLLKAISHSDIKSHAHFNKTEKATLTVERGARNTTLTSLVGKWINKGLDIESIRLMVTGWNSHLTEPLDEKEIENTVNSMFRTNSRDNSKTIDSQPYDTGKFFNGKEFKPMKVVEDLNEKIDCFYDGNDFYIYADTKGVWIKTYDQIIMKMISSPFGENVRIKYTNEVFSIYKNKCFKSPDELEQDRFLINLKNCMFDIRSNKILPHDKNNFSRVQIPNIYDPDALCPKFENFLEEICYDDPNKILALQDFAGYCLYPKIIIHKALILWGEGANGKSVFVNTLRKIIGDENCSFLAIHQLSDKFQLGCLKDKLLNVSTEVEAKKMIESSIFKLVVAGDVVSADKKFGSPFNFRPIAKHIFSINEIPFIPDRSHALLRRLIMVKFNRTFTDSEQNKNLEYELAEELPGILNWCLEGLQRLLKNNIITETETMKKDKNRFEQSLNNVISFVNEECDLAEEFEFPKKELFRAYKDYCDESKIKPMGRNKFYDQLTKSFSSITEGKESGDVRYFKGIKCKNIEDDILY